MDDGMRFVMRLEDGESLGRLCREFGISRKTGHRILERREACGLERPSDQSRQPSQGIPEPHCPFHDRPVVLPCCGRLSLYRKTINPSRSLAGQAVGLHEADEGVWLVTFME